MWIEKLISENKSGVGYKIYRVCITSPGEIACVVNVWSM